MSLLLIIRGWRDGTVEPPPPIDPEPPPVKRRNKAGIKTIIERAMDKGQFVTLEQALELLRANW